MFTILFLYGSAPPHEGNPGTYADCYDWAKRRTRRGRQWAIRRNSDNVIICQSKGFKA